jgi:hypothetical protein
VKILLDECVDQRFRNELKGHDVTTVQEAGWAGKKNGELLTLAASKYEAFITVDRNLSFQQNLPNLNIAVLVLISPTNRLADLRLLTAEVMAGLRGVKPGVSFIPKPKS